MCRNIILNTLGIPFLLLGILWGGQVQAQSGKEKENQSQLVIETEAKPGKDLQVKEMGVIDNNIVKGTEGKIQNISYKTTTGINLLTIMQILIALIFVLVIAYFAIWLLKKYNTGWILGKNLQDSKLTLIEVKRLTPKLSVFLIGVGDETVLLAQSGDSVSFYKGSLPVTIKSAEKSQNKNT